MTDAPMLSPGGRELVPLEHALVSTFEVTRGTFTIPAELIEAAELGDDYELRRLFARSLPDAAPNATVSTSRKLNRDGSATVTWRRILVRTRRA